MEILLGNNTLTNCETFNSGTDSCNDTHSFVAYKRISLLNLSSILSLSKRSHGRSEFRIRAPHVPSMISLDLTKAQYHHTVHAELCARSSN
jgi:hypothetical protein